MLKVGISTAITYFLFLLFERGKDRGLSGWVVFSYVLAPSLLIFLLFLIFPQVAPPNWVSLPPLLLYFFIPMLMLRFQHELSWGRSCAYGTMVLLVVVMVDFILWFAMLRESSSYFLGA